MSAAGARIMEVEKGGLGDAVGLEPGDTLVSIDGHPLRDLIDYRYYLSGDRVTLEVLKARGDRWLIEVEKGCDDDLGIRFHDDVFDRLRRCCNRCVFCFVDQLPPGLRPSLYIKDDDYRLSFLHGNFISLTNVSPRDMARICRWRLGPLYVSVHTVDPVLRARMMGNPHARAIMSQLRMLARAGVPFHAQVVLCPGINDGPHLEKTVAKLSGLWPAARSLAVVPVGLTAHRAGLPPLRPCEREDAVRALELVEAWQIRCKRRFGSRFVYAADELYLLAGDSFPAAGEYEDYPQLENGVGLVRHLEESWRAATRTLPRALRLPRRVTVASGVSGSQVIVPLVTDLARIRNLEVEVVAVPNRFFGDRVTVSGLLAGSDLCRSLRGRPPVDAILIQAATVREGFFLDQTSLDGLAGELGVPVVPVPAEGTALLEALLGDPGQYDSLALLHRRAGGRGI